MIKKILVIGGTGMLGQPVVARLVADDYQVKVLTHSPEKAAKVFGKQVETVIGDVTDMESLKEPIRDCDAVYINLNARMIPPDYERLEYQGTANIAQVAAHAGIKRIAMISGLNVSEKLNRFPFVLAKARAEKALINCGIPYTVFKCCWFYESLPLFVIGKQAVIFGRQPHQRSWIAATDYAMMVSRAFSNEQTANRVFHMRGTAKYTLGEALKEFCRIAFPDVKFLSTPLWLMTLVTKFSRQPTSRGVADLMRYFNAVPDTETVDDTEKILGSALTTLRDWSEDYRIKMVLK